MSPCRTSVERIARTRIAGAAVLRASSEQIAEWRKQPVVVGGEKLPISFLRNAEDQTVVALRCVLAVVTQQGWQGRSFADWGTITAANFFGRAAIAHTVQRFQQEGPWGVSPHSIPHQSLHAPAGTISLALKIHGPNFGVGGGPNAAPDAFLLGAALLADRLPGLWLVLSGHETEYVPIRDTQGANAPICQSVALALTPDGIDTAGPALSVGQVVQAGAMHDLTMLPDFRLGSFADAISAIGERSSSRWRLSVTNWLEITSAAPEGTS